MENNVIVNDALPSVDVNNAVLPTEKDTIAVLMALLEGLSYNVLSADAWWLSMHSASHLAVEKYNISPEVVQEVMNRFENARKSKGKQNPMHSMF